MSVQKVGMISPLGQYKTDTPECSTHEGEPLLMYCRTCWTYACPDCVDAEHRNHNVMSAKAQVKQLQGHTEEAIKEMEGKSVEQEEARQQLATSIDHLKEELPADLRERAGQEQLFVGKLDQQRQELLDLIDKDYNEKKDRVQERFATYNRAFEGEVNQMLEKAKEVEGKMQEKQKYLASATDGCKQLDESPSFADVYSVFPSVDRLVSTDVVTSSDLQLEYDVSEVPTSDFPDLSVTVVSKTEFADAATTPMAKDVEFLRHQMKNIQLLNGGHNFGGREDVYVTSGYMKDVQAFRDGKTSTPPGPLQTLHPEEAYSSTAIIGLSESQGRSLDTLLGGDTVTRDRYHSQHVDVQLYECGVKQVETKASYFTVEEKPLQIWESLGQWLLPKKLKIREAVKLALALHRHDSPKAVQEHCNSRDSRPHGPNFDIKEKTVHDWYNPGRSYALDVWK